MPVQRRVAKDKRLGGVRERKGRHEIVEQILLVKLSDGPQTGNRIPGKSGVRVKSVLGMIAGNQNPRVAGQANKLLVRA